MMKEAEAAIDGRGRNGRQCRSRAEAGFKPLLFKEVKNAQRTRS